MKYLLASISLVAIIFSGIADVSIQETFDIPQVQAAVRVRGYTRRDGTYVRPHYRSNPDGIRSNNWSYPGNVNPYTGVRATGNPSTYLRNSRNRNYSIPSISSYSNSLDSILEDSRRSSDAIMRRYRKRTEEANKRYDRILEDLMKSYDSTNYYRTPSRSSTTRSNWSTDPWGSTSSDSYENKCRTNWTYENGSCVCKGDMYKKTRDGQCVSVWDYCETIDQNSSWDYSNRGCFCDYGYIADAFKSSCIPSTDHTYLKSKRQLR